MADVRVFISYSSNDADVVERLKDGLARAGVDVWLDHEQLTPGAPNWQKAIREGVAQATQVIYVASQTAAESEYVYDEISLARGKGKPVIPFWARGTEWHDCIPLGWGLTQHVDGRGSSFDAGLSKLLTTLGAGASRHVQRGSVAPTASVEPLPTLSYSLPDVPARLASLGFRGVNASGTPAIIPPLITIPAGPFFMGSDKATEVLALENHAPQHRVEVAAFQIATYPVTVAEYALAVAAKAVREPPGLSEYVTWADQQQHPDHPIACVSWQDAQKYVAWLVQATGQRGWRLPTEAEWEKAARWGPGWDAQRNESRLYPWGDAFDENRCNTIASGIDTTSPVGSYPASDVRRSGASAYDVEELAGNVYEWTSSLLKPYPYTQTDGREDQDSTDKRVMRGNFWGGATSFAHAACRYGAGWDSLGYGYGFRLAFTPGAGSS
jgi:formylglycine-generating enzyme required for sulfatase activity